MALHRDLSARSIREIPDGGVGLLIESRLAEEDHGRMWSDDILRRVRLLIGDFRQQAGPDGPSPQDACRYVALHLGMSEARAREVIVCAALQDAERTRENHT